MVLRNKRKIVHQEEDDDEIEDLVTYEDHDTRHHLGASPQKQPNPQPQQQHQHQHQHQKFCDSPALSESDSDGDSLFRNPRPIAPIQPERVPVPPPRKQPMPSSSKAGKSLNKDHNDAWLQLQSIATSVQDQYRNSDADFPVLTSSTSTVIGSKVTFADAQPDLKSHETSLRHRNPIATSGGSGGKAIMSASLQTSTFTGNTATSRADEPKPKRAVSSSACNTTNQPVLSRTSGVLDVGMPAHWGSVAPSRRSTARSQTTATDKSQTQGALRDSSSMASKKLRRSKEQQYSYPTLSRTAVNPDNVKVAEMSFRPSWLEPSTKAAEKIVCEEIDDANGDGDGGAECGPSVQVDEVEAGGHMGADSPPMREEHWRNSSGDTSSHHPLSLAASTPHHAAPHFPSSDSHSGSKRRNARAGTLRARLNKLARRLDGDETAIVNIKAKQNRDLNDPRQRAQVWVDGVVVKILSDDSPFCSVLLYVHGVGAGLGASAGRGRVSMDGVDMDAALGQAAGFTDDTTELTHSPLFSPVRPDSLLIALMKHNSHVASITTPAACVGYSTRIYDPLCISMKLPYALPRGPKRGPAANMFLKDRLLTCTQLQEAYPLPAVPSYALEAAERIVSVSL